MKISKNAKNAICIGTLCSIAYLAVYVARNILSAVTPQMIENGFSEEYIGSISSLYFAFYAVGQLINGIVGDRIKARYMISLGLILAAITNVVFVFVAATPFAASIAYAMTGFFLAMIYGPMTKVVAENTEPLHAVRCSLGYTFASFLGTPAAGMLAAFLPWQSVFHVSGGILAAMGVAVFVFFLVFEKKGIVRYGKFTRVKKEGGGVKVLFRYGIVKYSLVSILTGIVRTSVIFWLPTYISQALNFSPSDAAGIFTAASFIISTTTFITIFIYERTGKNMDRTTLIMFIASALGFTATYFLKEPVINIICMVIAIMAANGASTVLWSIYCPSLRDTGMVSGATGFLDFLSYMAAALANVLFANAVTSIGWGNLVLVWIGLMVIGVVVSLPFFNPKPINDCQDGENAI